VNSWKVGLKAKYDFYFDVHYVFTIMYCFEVLYFHLHSQVGL
jgi:hypothetical protein